MTVPADARTTAPLAALAGWPRRRWAVASGTAVLAILLVGLSTVLIPNPVFGREIAPTWWSWPVLLVTATLSGLLAATYVGRPEEARVPRSGLVGGLLAYLAVGCPVCNKVALLALGYAGALQWFAPVQPLLAAAAVVLLWYALRRRLLGDVSCPITLPR